MFYLPRMFQMKTLFVRLFKRHKLSMICLIFYLYADSVYNETIFSKQVVKNVFIKEGAKWKIVRDCMLFPLEINNRNLGFPKHKLNTTSIIEI